VASAPAERRAALTPAHKCAVLLTLLEEDGAASILGGLPPDQIEAIGVAMTDIANVDRVTIMGVLNEFLAHAATDRGLAAGPEQFRHLLVKAIGERRAGPMIERLRPAARGPDLSGLDWVGARGVTEFLAGEPPQVTAAALTLLPEATSGAVFQALPPDVQPEILHRVATIGKLGEIAIQLLREALEGTMAFVAPADGLTIDGSMKAVRLLKRMPGEANSALLEALRGRDPALAEVIEENMLRFEDLAEMPAKSLQQLIQAVDGGLLALALRGTDEALRERILTSMSTRAAQSLADEMESRGRVKREEIDSAKSQIMKIAKRLAADGKIELRETSEDG